MWGDRFMAGNDIAGPTRVLPRCAWSFALLANSNCDASAQGSGIPAPISDALQSGYVLFFAGGLVGIILTVLALYLSIGLRHAIAKLVHANFKAVTIRPRHAGFLVAVIVLPAVLAGEITFARASVAVLAGGLALIALTRVVQLFAQGDRIELQSHWGGLGGGLGGWRLSPVAGLVLLTVALCGVAIAAITGLPTDKPRPGPEQNDTARPKAEPKAEQPTEKSDTAGPSKAKR
jgi:hypothetical protein